MGYWAAPLREVVITEVIGAGPRALHQRYAFSPDADYQEKEIASVYHGSGRVHTYLGDWHSHPHATARLSARDRQTMYRIGRHAEARTECPLIAILAGGPPWVLEVWNAHFQSTRCPALIKPKPTLKQFF
jgi:integrative and conjugative element protein (TIGR02256 family)